MSPKEPLWEDKKCHPGNAYLFDADENDEYPHLAEAQALCAVCPVREACKTLGRKEKSGIWGGEAK